MLWYAHGPVRESQGIPASAFSKGDLLMYNSASSLSRIPTSSQSVGALAKGTVVGVAKSSSLESIDNKVCYIVATEQTVFWSDATIGSQYTAGEGLDVEYTGATFRVTTSAISPMLRIDPNGASMDVIDSVNSRVKVMFDPTWVLFRYSN